MPETPTKDRYSHSAGIVTQITQQLQKLLGLDNLLLLSKLHLGDILPHLPGGDAVGVHLIHLGIVALRRLGHVEPDQDADEGAEAEEQPGRVVSPVGALGIDYDLYHGLATGHL